MSEELKRKVHLNAHSASRPSAGSGSYGLTKREHFAGLALQGLLANSDLTNEDASQYAKDAVSLADKLLEALGKSSP